jgi:pimeloyl-ACP methyl ester carboxylesterase
MPIIRPYSPERASAKFDKTQYTEQLQRVRGEDRGEFKQETAANVKEDLSKLPNDAERIGYLYQLSKLTHKHEFFNSADFHKLLQNENLLKAAWKGKNLMHIICERGSAKQIKETALAYHRLKPFENPFSGPRRAWVFSKSPLDRINNRQDLGSAEKAKIHEFIAQNCQDWSWSIKNIVGYYFPNLRKTVEREVFVGWNQNERHKQNVSKLAELRKQYPEITDEQIGRYQSAKDKKDTDAVKELEKIKGLAEIARLSGYVKKYEAIQKSAKTTREDLKEIGAEPVTISTTDGAQLDGVFVSADNFLNTLKRSGAKRVLVGGQPVGFILPNDKIIQERLTRLGLVGDGKPDTKGKEYEWLRQVASDGRVVLLPNTPENQNLDLSQAQLGEADIESNGASRGTVILTSGAIGVYEVHKREIMSFLARGLNVMCFNYRGYGQSTGTPNERSVHTDIEAVYQHLRTKKIENQDIIVKSLCMSGAAGTRLAAKHPGINLLLDQTYTHIKEYLDLEFERMLANMPGLKLVPEKYFAVRGWLAKTLAESLAPNWSVHGDISKVKGRVGVIVTSEDVNTSVDQATANIEALLSSGNERVSLYPMPGEHADSWMDTKTRDVTPDSFLAATYTEKIPRDRSVLTKAIERHIQAFKGASSDEDKKKALDALDELCTPEIISQTRHERVQEALVRLYNDIGILRKKLKFGTLSKPADTSTFIGRQIINNFFRKTGHLKPIVNS